MTEQNLSSQSSGHATGFPVQHLENEEYLVPDLIRSLYSSKVPQAETKVCKGTLKKLIAGNKTWMKISWIPLALFSVDTCFVVIEFTAFVVLQVTVVSRL